MRRLAVVSSTLCALLFPGGAQAWTWPIDGPVLRPFVFGSDPYAAGQHRGIDVGGAVGESVRAPVAGTVSFAGSVPAGGRALTIRTGDGYSVTLLQLGSIAVQRGDEVGEGARVGAVGESSDAATREPHVHLGVRRTVDEEGYLDPLAFLPERPRVVAPAPAPAASPPPVQPQPAPPPPRVEQPAPPPAAAAPQRRGTGAPPLRRPGARSPWWPSAEPPEDAGGLAGRSESSGRPPFGRARRAAQIEGGRSPAATGRRPGCTAQSGREPGARAAPRDDGATPRRASRPARRRRAARPARLGDSASSRRPSPLPLARRDRSLPAPLAAPARARPVDPRGRRDRRVHGHAKGTTYH